MIKKRKKSSKKISKKKVEEVLPEGVNLGMVELWVQDESRVGQQGVTTRMWCEKGTRPRAVKQGQFTYAYIFGAACPEKDLAVGLVMPYVNTAIMEKHLIEISKHVSPGKHAIILIDRASWHTAKKLNIPKNLSLLPQPPYSPELNSSEQIWQYLKEHYLANRCFDGYEDIAFSCVEAWNNLVSIPGKIKSLCSRSWMAC